MANSELALENAPDEGATEDVLSAREFEVLSRRRIYILPTRQGVGFGAMLLVVLLGSANYNNGLGYALSFLLASLGLISLVHTYRNLVGLGIRLNPAQPAFVGRPCTFTVSIDNRSAASRPAIVARLRSRAAGSTVGQRRWWRRRPNQSEGPAEVIANANLQRDALSTLELGVIPEQRGWLEVERLVVATRFPFGLFRAWSVPRVDVRTLIYPAPAGDRPLPDSGGGGRLDAGAVARGEEDFAGLREYLRGDSLKRVHWKALARELGLQVKQFSGGSPVELALNWADTVGPTEDRLSQLTRWVVQADRAGFRYKLVLGGRAIGPGQGLVQSNEALRELALYRLPDARRNSNAPESGAMARL